jgi:hypothetical protein
MKTMKLTTMKLKRRLALFVAIIMALTLWTAVPLQASAADETDSDSQLTYTVSNNEATITGYAGDKDALITLPIPPTVGDNIPVTGIAYTAFYGCSSLESLSIPASVETIEILEEPQLETYFIFYDCVSLTDITVDPNNQFYSSDGGVLFDKDKSTLVYHPKREVTSFSIPQGVTSIGTGAFAYHTLETIALPEGVTNIGHSAFIRCADLANVTLPQSLTYIKRAAFYGCSLISIEIPANVTTIDAYAFSQSGLISVTIPVTVTSIGTGMFQNCLSLVSATIEANVTSIGAQLFQGCTNLATVTLPNTATSIDGGFYQCYNLSSITLPTSLQTIGEYTFSGNKLETITLPNGLLTIGQGAFNSSALTSLTIPATVTSIGASAFYNCQDLESVVIQGATDIGQSAFYSCTGLETVDIQGAASIGEDAFRNCSSLETVEMESVTTIGANAFRSSGLVSITIPAAITTFDRTIIDNCASLTSINVASDHSVFESENGVLLSKDKKTLIRWPMGKTEGTIPSSVETINQFSFERNLLTSITIPTNVTTIGWAAFQNSALASITLPQTVTSINSYAFSGCTSLGDVVFLKNDSFALGDTAFLNCDLEKLKLWSYSGSNVSTYATGNYNAGGARNLPYGFLLDHITLDDFALNNGASQTLVPEYFATSGTDSAKDALVETPAITEASSNATGVATVDNNGKITAVGDGSATITAKVTSLSGDVKTNTNTCTVTVTTPDATITSFKLKDAGNNEFIADISPDKIITVEVPAGSDLTNLTPVIEVKSGASVSPPSGMSNNFTNPVTYTVTQGSANGYTVVVTMPQDTPDVAINYVDETLTGLIAGEKYTFNGTQETVSEVTREIDPAWFGSELSIVRKGNGARILDSAAQPLIIPAKPDAPEGITTEGETIVGKNNGVIYGIATDMEYRKVADNQAANEGWIDPGVDDEVGDLAAGDYQVRIKQEDSNFAGTPVTVNVAAGVAQTRILTVTAPTFVDVTAGYTRPDAEAIVIANSGNSTATIESVTVSPETAFEIGGSGATVDPSDEIGTWTIQPKAGLSADTYTATITVTYDGTSQTTATANVSFKVNAVVIPPPPAAETYALTVTGGTDNTNAGPYEEGASVSITAGEPADGKVFDTWTTSAGGSFTDATKESTTFTMPANAVTVTATYKDDPNAGNGEPGDDNPPDNPPAKDNGWVKNDDGEWEYLTGGEAKTGWLYDTNYKAWYYLASDGVMQTGWDYVGGKWYYLASNGKMQTGWLKDNGSWYYLSRNGAMVVNKWFKDTNGSWYYLSGNGKMLTGKQTIGGKTYTFKANGVWVG